MAPTRQPLPRSSPASITNLTSCTPSVLSSTTMSAKAWKKVSSLKLVKTWQPWRKTTKRWELRLPREKARKRDMAMSSESLELLGLLEVQAALSQSCDVCASGGWED